MAGMRRNRPFVERAKTTEPPGRDTADRHLAPVDLTFPRLRRRARTAPRQWMGELGWVFRIEQRHLSSAQSVTNLTVATEATDQCDTRIDRAQA